MTPLLTLLPGSLSLLLATAVQVTEPALPMKSPVDSVSIRVAILPSPTDAMPASATLTIQVGDGVSGSESGIPGFIVQLDPPKGLRLLGDPIIEFKELHANQFLMEPWERLVTEEETKIGFAVEGGFDPSSTLGISVIGYVAEEARTDETPRKEAFLRRRFELKIEHGAVAQPGDASDSSWGPPERWPVGERPLFLGDKAPSFVGPSLNADGSLGQGSLETSLSAGPVLVAFYRGHW